MSKSKITIHKLLSQPVQPVPKWKGESSDVPARHPSSEKFHALLKELGDLHDLKQKDYGVKSDPFANVRNSTAFGVPAWVGCMIRANDKMKRLQAFAINGSLANEGVKDSFLDLAVYAVIGLILFNDEGKFE